MNHTSVVYTFLCASVIVGGRGDPQHHADLPRADRLVLSPKTVRNNVSNIFSKLQVAELAQDRR